jgi:tetratricopeptide (TPR) repeat protein
MAPERDGAIAEPPAPRALDRPLRQALWLAQGHLQAEDFPAAERAFGRIVQAEPRCAEAWFFLGVVRQQDKDPAGAAANYQQAIRLAPDLAEAHNNLGVSLQDQGQIVQAEECFREALRLLPDYAEASSNLGNALQDQGRYAESIEAYREALALRPGFLDALKHLGNALRALGRIGEAMACYDAGLRLAPDHVLLHMARAMVWIQEGNFTRGWAECEWRLRGKDCPVPACTQPLWDGSPLEGRTILVYAEQGLGDTIQFLRYLPRIAERGGRVVLACAAALVRIARSCPGVAEVVTEGSLVQEFACYAPLLSLPWIFGTTLETVPSEVPYLAADPERISHWRNELDTLKGFKIGVVWQGNPGHTKDRERSFPLEKLEAVARVPGVRLYSLQKNFGIEQIERNADRFLISDLGPRLDDLVDTAAAMASLDLVISADSAPAHLAGALGVPVWVALPFTADWRWMTGREDSPWYPSLRLFRQRVYGDWDGVFDDMALALRPILEDRR